VLSCSGSFHSPAFFDDRLQVTVKIEKLPLVRIEAFYEVKRKGELIATGMTKHAFVSSKGRVVRPPEDFVELARAKFTD
jgi:acyl-CoA thioesterase FadM